MSNGAKSLHEYNINMNKQDDHLEARTIINIQMFLWKIVGIYQLEHVSIWKFTIHQE